MFQNKQRRIKEIGVVLLFFLVFAFYYNVVLWYNQGVRDSTWYNLEGFWQRAGMQYVFLLFGAILIWWIAVHLSKTYNTVTQVLFTVTLIPIVTFLFRSLRYSMLNALDIWHLNGKGAVWDFYIPTLFYLVLFGFYFMYQYFLDWQEKQQLETELRQAALKSELSAMKAQLNPHFLYNVFNTINASLPPENEKTREMVASLADLFRYQLRISNVDTVPLREEVAFIQKYLELEQKRFEERLQIQIDVDPSLLDRQVPPMLIQPLVENSIKHGLASKIDGGSVALRIQEENGQMVVQVSDTGVGKVKDVSFEKGVGLGNTNKRLQKMFQTELQVFENVPEGLTVQFSI